MTVLLAALAAGSILLAGYWAIALGVILNSWLKLPSARAGLALPTPGASVCVIVPAHNEQDVIGGLVASLIRQDHPRLRIVLALDRCTDGTEAAARDAAAGDPRVEILSIAECPEGWAGKVHAAWAGYTRSESARGADLVLFTDADTAFEPGAVRAAAALLESRRLDLLSLLCTMPPRAWYEHAAQPAAGLELARQFPLLRANRDRAPRPFANGQFMLVRRDAYEAIGGHARVRDDLLEDIAMALELSDAGRRTGILLAGGLVRCRMYHAWDEFKRGWARIYIEASHLRPDRLRRASWMVRAFGVLLPLVAAGAVAIGLTREGPIAGVEAAAGLLGIGAMLAAVAASQRLARAPAWTCVLYPLGAWLVGGILARAARDVGANRPIVWGGRRYTPAERRASIMARRRARWGDLGRAP